MKKAITMFAAALCLVFAAACAAPAEQNKNTPVAVTVSSAPAPSSAVVSQKPEAVVFNDEVLEKLVRKEMKKPEGDITVAEAEAVENLNLGQEGGKPIPRAKDITALKYFKNLKGLDLSYNLIEDLSPLAGLTRLEGLQYWGAESVKDFSALKNMTNMLDLLICGMNGTHFTNVDMKNISGMTKLEMLWLQGAKDLTDISPAANFKKLYRLNVDYTGVGDISVAAGLANLAEVDLRGSKVKDVTPLKNLTNLKKVYIKGSQVKDTSPLKKAYKNLEDKDF